MIGIILFDIEKANSRMRLSPILERDVGRNYAARGVGESRILGDFLYGLGFWTQACHQLVIQDDDI